MTITTTCLLLVFAAYALGNWWAVEVGNQRLEWLCKPAAMVALIGAAIAISPDDPSVKIAFIIGLVLSLAGDVFLLLPTDRFLFGLVSFFLAHVAYVVGFLLAGPEPSSQPVEGATPIPTTTTSASTTEPSARRTRSTRSPPSNASTPTPRRTRTP